MVKLRGDYKGELTGRELELLRWIVLGVHSNKDLAMCMSISRQTVKNHFMSINKKLGVDDRTNAILVALQRGIINLYEDPNKLLGKR
jgi:two-component system, NarL family, response regulator